MDVRLPDGTIIANVPEGTTKAQLMEKLGRGGYDVSKLQAPEPQPLKIGAEGYGDALRETLRAADWGTRNVAGAGQAVRNLWQGGKQLLTGKVDPAAVAESKAFASEAPVGTIGGAVGMALPTLLIPGANTATGAAAVGAATNLLAPDEEGRAGQARNALVGGALGAAGQVGGKLVADKVGPLLQNAATRRANTQAANAVRDATLERAQQAGYVVPPSYAGAGMFSRILEGLSGKYKTNQLAGIKNQEVTDELARKAIGLPTGAPLTAETTQALRAQAYKAGYEPVAAAGVMPTDASYAKALDALAGQLQGAARSFPGAVKNDVAELVESLKVAGFDAGDALKMTQVLRDEAAAAFASGNKALGKAQRGAAEAIEEQIERNLSAMGQNGADMLKSFRDARTLMAKTHTVEEAVRRGGGTVDAKSIGRRVQKGKPVSGELETIGKFANVFPDVAGIPKSGNANPFTIIDMGVGGFGAGSANPLLAALPLARVAARQSILSRPYQNALVGPNYGPGTLNRLANLALTGEVPANALRLIAPAAAPLYGAE